MCCSFRQHLVQLSHITGNISFAECLALCRVQNIGHSAKRLFAECSPRGTRQRKSTRQKSLCRVPDTRQRKALGKGTYLPSAKHSAKMSTRQPLPERCPRASPLPSACRLTLGNEGAFCRVPKPGTRQTVFFLFLN